MSAAEFIFLACGIGVMFGVAALSDHFMGAEITRELDRLDDEPKNVQRWS